MSNPVVNLILLRGLPGSGKTTLSKALSNNGKFPVFSIDEYFTDKDGNYTFDYSFNSLGNVGSTHSLNLGYDWN